MILTPKDETEVSVVVADAKASNTPLEILGGGSKRGLGRPVQATKTLDVSGLSGITLYEPGALTIVAKTGTPVSEIEAALADEGQRLPFEPMDYRGLLGSDGEPTIGGTVAVNNSGPRRIQAGACRDSLIGVRFVNGSGDVIKNGGRVMKNVTGLDLVKLMCGSYGTLGVLTEVSFKVLPVNEREATLAMSGLTLDEARRAMSAALGSPFEVTGAAVVPEAEGVTTALRVEGFSGQVDYRLGKLRDLLGGNSTVLEGVAHDRLWQRARNVEDLFQNEVVWKISVKPSDGAIVAATLESRLNAKVSLDWGGGLVWAGVSTEASPDVRATVDGFAGHATLIKGPPELRARVPVFQPQHPRLAQLSENIRAKFDPSGILNSGRMVA